MYWVWCCPVGRASSLRNWDGSVQKQEIQAPVCNWATAQLSNCLCKWATVQMCKWAKLYHMLWRIISAVCTVDAHPEQCLGVWQVYIGPELVLSSVTISQWQVCNVRYGYIGDWCVYCVFSVHSGPQLFFISLATVQYTVCTVDEHPEQCLGVWRAYCVVCAVNHNFVQAVWLVWIV